MFYVKILIETQPGIRKALRPCIALAGSLLFFSFQEKKVSSKVTLPPTSSLLTPTFSQIPSRYLMVEGYRNLTSENCAM